MDEKKNKISCVEDCMRRPHHKGYCTVDLRTAVALDRGDAGVPQPRSEHVTEGAVNEAMTVLERRIRGRLSELAARVKDLEDQHATAPHWSHAAAQQINAKATELVDRPDPAQALDRLHEAIELMSDKLLPTNVITQHMTTSTERVLHALARQAAPQSVSYPFERDGSMVLGPDTYLRADGTIVHKGHGYRASVRWCGATDNGEPWCEQPVGHTGNCDPEPENYPVYG